MRELPHDAVAHDGFAFLATWVADQAGAVIAFNDHMAAVGGHHQALGAARGVGHLGFAAGAGTITVALHAWSWSTRAAQMKSLMDKPPTEWVLKRTVQRL